MVDGRRHVTESAKEEKQLEAKVQEKKDVPEESVLQFSNPALTIRVAEKTE